MRLSSEMPGSGDSSVRDATTGGGPEPSRLDLLYRQHAPGLRRRLRGRVGSAEEANDLVQDAFTRLVGASAAGSLREPAAFLNRVVRNLLIDRSRRRLARPPHVALGAEVDVAVAPDQGQQLEVEQMRRRYREIVEALPPRMREVFILHRVEGVGYRDIAERLDISIRTVEWHIAQAIVRIGRGLDEQ